LLRAGNAGPDTAADHIQAARLALAQLPRQVRRRVLIRTDSGGGTREFLDWLTRPGRRLAYSVGFTITEEVQAAILKVPARAWAPAYDAGGEVRPGALGSGDHRHAGPVRLAGRARGTRPPGATAGPPGTPAHRKSGCSATPSSQDHERCRLRAGYWHGYSMCPEG